MYKFGPELDPATVAWLKKGAVFPETLEVHLRDDQIRRYTILERDEHGVVEALREGRRGKKGFVLCVRDQESGDNYAAKLCIPEDYTNSTPLTELEFSNALKDLDELVLRPKVLGTVKRFETEPRHSETSRWICFISEWLEGITLRDLIDQSAEEITPALVAHVAKDLLTAILVMEEMGYKHDDLNLGNLMLEQPNARLAAINPAKAVRRLRIIDLGSMKPFDKATTKPDDDWSLSARCLAELHNTLHANRSLASQHPLFLKSLRDFIHDLADDPSRKFPDRGDYIRSIERAEQLITIEPRAETVFHPLEAISAEHLADDDILLKLFVKHLPWLSLVQGPNPCVLIGPRGCGKSMVFRYMATKTHITSKESNASVLKESGIFGVYVGCSSDLGHDLVWLSRKGKGIADYVDQISDYFNLVVARELMRALASAACATEFTKALGLTEQGKRRVADFLEGALEKNLRRVHVSGMEIFQSCADTLDRLRLGLAREMRTGPGPGLGTGATFLRDLCAKIVEEMPAFKTYSITFLLDDYTEHRISKPVQEILNGIIFQRVPWMIFKVSSEPYGFDSATFFETRVDPVREYVPIDAGTNCLDMSAADRRLFVTDLLDRRLRVAKFAGTADTLIGESQYISDPKLAEAIRSRRKGKHTYYNGLNVLSNAWSGDVATVLHIVNNMFADAGVNAMSNNRISNDVQHNAIVRVSKGLRGRVQSYSPFGQDMSVILSAFGDLAARLLIDYRARVRNGNSGDINRKYRIEWTLPEGADTESELTKFDPSGGLYSLYKELIRRAVFHENLQSRGKEGPGRRTVRLQIRSSLLPSFGTSLQHENHLKIDKTDEFVEFLTRTRRWTEGVIARYSTPEVMLGGLFDERGDTRD
ncbi:hypothetical protein [Xanthomonas bundabergensis]|uniref:ORC-CDC6 family AAA ATPase n=1 Tax=Xanthomonas bundabergensis TaxID=3160842 RepID=UPI003513D365